MSTASTLVSPPDIGTIITSLGVFSLAVAAVVGGIYKGIKEVKKGGADTGQEVRSAVLVETVTLTMLTEAHRSLTVAICERLIPLLSQIERHMDLEQQIVGERDRIARASVEEAHRLRVAITDLHEFMRSQRR